ERLTSLTTSSVRYYYFDLTSSDQRSYFRTTVTETHMALADAAALLVEAIWPLSSAVCRNEINNKSVLPLRTFIQETLKRSRTSYSTLQVTMYYLILIKDHVPQLDF